MVDQVILFHRSRGRRVDGIRDHGERLATELSKRGVEASHEPKFLEGTASRLSAWLKAWRRLHALDRRSAVLIQYNPFSFGRWGFAPWLPALLLTLRVRRRRPVIAVMVHEAYVPMISLRWTLMGAWQRLQLAAVRLSADVVFTSVEIWAEKLARWRPRRPVHHLPVGSNFPDGRAARREEQQPGDRGDEKVVVAVFGREDRTWLSGHATEALNGLVRTGRQVVLLNLGASAPRLPDISPAIRVETPGYQNPGELARTLARADLFLAPLDSGISTRRGTVMAALQHAVPVVATAGPVTDPVLLHGGPGIILSPAGDPTAFAAAAAAAADDEYRAARAEAARHLYERNFDWPVVSERLLGGL